MKVFLGGTCNNSTWRDKIIPQLECKYFNPIVRDWTPNCIAIEDNEKSMSCDTHLYVFTPLQTGYYGPVEVLDSHLRGKRVMVVILEEDNSIGFYPIQMSEAHKRSFDACYKIYKDYGIPCGNSLVGAAASINNIELIEIKYHSKSN